jgi:hypothetical protein
MNGISKTNFEDSIGCRKFFFIFISPKFLYINNLQVISANLIGKNPPILTENQFVSD